MVTTRMDYLYFIFIILFLPDLPLLEQSVIETINIHKLLLKHLLGHGDMNIIQLLSWQNKILVSLRLCNSLELNPQVIGWFWNLVTRRYRFNLYLLLGCTIVASVERVDSPRIWAFLVNFAPPSNTKMQGISSTHCIKSLEYCLGPVTQQIIEPCLCKYNEQMDEIFLGTWPTIVSPFITATAKASFKFPSSLLHGSSSPPVESQVSLQVW